MSNEKITREQFDALPPKLKESLSKYGVYKSDLVPDTSPNPYTQAGAASLKGSFVMPSIAKEYQGITTREGNDQPSSASAVILAPNQPPYVKAHEMEHVLANQGLGVASRLNSLWDAQVGKEGATRGEIVKRLLEHAPHLVKEWGLPQQDLVDGYFSPTVAKRSDMHNFLYEQLASLSAAEQDKNKRFTDDPYVRKHILKTPAERETFDALTGLRQTRLDAKDLPPYTRQKEKSETVKNTGMFESLKRKIKDVF